MKRYKCTIIKDLPNYKKGFSFIVGEGSGNNHNPIYNYHFLKWEGNEISCDLLNLVDNKEWIKKEISYYGVIDFKCKCGNTNGEILQENRIEQDDGVVSYYTDIYKICYKCNRKTLLTSVLKNTKIVY